MLTLINNATIINENKSFPGSVLIKDEKILEVLAITTPIGRERNEQAIMNSDRIIDATGMIMMPGVIDDQVHFREPGQTEKANIETDSAAAVLGGVTSYMDMPNNQPPICDLKSLEKKYNKAAEISYANYSFYLGANNSNIDEIVKADPNKICGLKVFMGSSTGNMLVDDNETLEKIFKSSPLPISTHCEEESIIKENLEKAISSGRVLTVEDHPKIRTREACIASTAKAIKLASKYNTHLHILHISTLEELLLIAQAKLMKTPVTNEICVHHLWFTDQDYKEYGNKIKCNPAIKTTQDRDALRKAVASGMCDSIGSDHAPHLLSEKQKDYLHCPSGIPLVQHTLQMMFTMADHKIFSRTQLVEMMCHKPAITFNIKDRGYLRSGYYADIVLVRDKSRYNYADYGVPVTVGHDNIAYKCEWSPFEGHVFDYKIEDVFVNGTQIVDDAKLTQKRNSKRLSFNRIFD
ncbi:MAG: dihydroorotase [Bacteroidales bacterium]